MGKDDYFFIYFRRDNSRDDDDDDDGGDDDDDEHWIPTVCCVPSSENTVKHFSCPELRKHPQNTFVFSPKPQNHENIVFPVFFLS